MSKLSIVGAGLVGSLWAYLLKKEGFEVEVFEKRPNPTNQPEQAGRSINLVVTSKGVHGLALAGLHQQVRNISVPVYGRIMHAKSGELSYQPYGRSEREHNLSVSRWQLNRLLIEQCLALGVKIHFEHDLEEVDIQKKSLLFKTPKGRRACSYDRLFATDGAGSKVREKVTPWTVDWLSADYKELFLPALADGTAAISLKGLHIWPRGTHMMMALANRDNSFTVTLYLPKTGHPFAFDQIQSEEKVGQLFQSEFADAIPLMPHYAEDFLRNPQGALGTVRSDTWVYSDSVALMGDAAHAIVPFFGQGMNLGFEDCTSLLSSYRRHKDWAKAFAEYDQNQRPNANAIADMALENFVEMRDSVGDPKFLFMKKLEALIEAKFPDLYRSRYGLITYTLTPYSLAKQAGLQQMQILAELMRGLDRPEDVNFDRAQQLIEQKLASLNLDLKTYAP